MNCPNGSQRFVADLCPACGLCCNGALFADVELSRKDAPDALQSSGLTLQRKRGKLAFIQPCACFDGQLCQIYAQRPTRCRTFVCGTLHRVQDGTLTAAAALKLIRQTRAQVQVVLDLLRALGDTAEELPLSRRYSRLMAEPIDLGGDEDRVETRARLMLEVARLMKRLQQDFLA
ncbi:MAG: YkgJ family cysteine cluster protein [Verrucomicrobiota bacterium]